MIFLASFSLRMVCETRKRYVSESHTFFYWGERKRIRGNVMVVLIIPIGHTSYLVLIYLIISYTSKYNNLPNFPFTPSSLTIIPLHPHFFTSCLSQTTKLYSVLTFSKNSSTTLENCLKYSFKSSSTVGVLGSETGGVEIEVAGETGIELSY